MSWALYPLDFSGNRPKPPTEPEHPLPNSQFSAFTDLGNGYVACKRTDGSFVSQTPNAYGKFTNAPEAKAYETFGGGSGIGVKTVWTRPAEGDQIFSYFCVQLPNS